MAFLGNLAPRGSMVKRSSVRSIDSKDDTLSPTSPFVSLPAQDDGKTSSFADLLDQLGSCYKTDMQELQDENGRLRNMLSVNGLADKSMKLKNVSCEGDQKISCEGDQNILLPGMLPTSDAPDGIPISPSKKPNAAPSFPLRDAWVFNDNVDQILSRSTVALQRKNTSNLHTDADEADLIAAVKANQKFNGFMSKFISEPASTKRVAWDMAGGVLIMYDMVIIPMKVFSYTPSVFTELMDWTTLLFWTANIAATLTVGYVKKGITIMSPSKILCNYLRTWFIVDCLVLIPDWLFTFFAGAEAEQTVSEDTGDGAGGGGEDAVKLLRMLRLARTLRLLRLLKLAWILDRINDYLDSEYASIISNVIKMIVLLLGINHIIACCWFAIAGNAEGSWVDAYDLLGADWVLQYLTSFHWSITQFTPASMHVQPKTMGERIFAIFVVIFALVGFSYVVGSITSSLAQLRSMSEGASKEFWLLRRFLRRNHVPIALQVRIQKFVEHSYLKQKERMTMGQVKMLSLLSDSLYEELMCAMNLPHLQVHPLFKFLEELSPITLQRLAKEAVGRIELAREDTLFVPSQSADHMYTVVSGRLLYSRSPKGGKEEEPRIEFVDAGEDWIAEPTLWSTRWVHVGELKAATEAELQTVDPIKFAGILCHVHHVAVLFGIYGRKFMEWTVKEGDLSDVIQGDLVSDVIESFIPKDGS